MQKYSRVFLVSVCSALILAGCAGSNSSILAKIGGDPLTLEQFEESYAKNNGGWEKARTSSIEDRQRFLDLLVKFHLKVREATERGLLADSSLRSELEGYKVTVATSYMVEKDIVEPRLKELYNRKLEELRASHILIRMSPEAASEDTLAAYNKAMKVIALVPTSIFDSLAATYSQDPSASINKGDLGYFMAGRMVPEFEDACYSLKVGEYTRRPVRTQFGYHIIKVTARNPYKGAVHVLHILRRFNATQSDSVAVRDTAWIVDRLLKSGLDFAQAAKRYSQDPASAQKGGDIGFYERGRIPPEIDKVFYGSPVDSVTEPVKMPYGYHIFKIVGFQGTPPFQDVEKDIRQQYMQTRYNADYGNYVHALKKRYHLDFDVYLLDQLTRSFDTTQTPSSLVWSDTLKAATRQKTLFTCEDHSYTVNDFIDHVNGTAEFKSMLLNPKNVQYMVERMSEAKIVEEHARFVPERYPAFVNLLKEYQDGILLYRIEQDEVWKKVVVNDSLLKLYYDGNKEKFRWPDRVNFAEIYVTIDSVAKEAHKEVMAGKDFGDVAAKYTMRPGYKEKKGVWGLTATSLNEFSRFAAKLAVDSIAPPFSHPTGWSIIKTLGKDSSRVKTFDEAMPELMSSYQEYASKVREQEWIAGLKERYPVVLRKELLPEAFKRNPVAKQ